MEPLLPLDRAEVFYDGTVSEPRLLHPEGVAVDGAGNVWCGGETGEIYRIDSEGESIETVASTGGFTLGIAFDRSGHLYTCDLERFAEGGPSGDIRIPNFPVVDFKRGCLYVSDSYEMGGEGPGIWRFDLETGEGGLWYDEPMNFANGLALDASGNVLYAVETFARRVIQIPIQEDGSPGSPQPFVEDLERLPDGLAFDVQGNLYIACYEPSRILRADPSGKVDLLIDDPEAHTLCHPTNVAFRGEELFTANLGRWHVTRIDVGVEGQPLI